MFFEHLPSYYAAVHVAFGVNAGRTTGHLAAIEVDTIPGHNVEVVGVDMRVGPVAVNKYPQGVIEERIAEQRTEPGPERAIIRGDRL